MPQTASVYCGGELAPISIWFWLWEKLLWETKLILFLFKVILQCRPDGIRELLSTESQWHPSTRQKTVIPQNCTLGKGHYPECIFLHGRRERHRTLRHAYLFPRILLQASIAPPFYASYMNTGPFLKKVIWLLHLNSSSKVTESIEKWKSSYCAPLLLIYFCFNAWFGLTYQRQRSYHFLLFKEKVCADFNAIQNTADNQHDN